MMKLKLLALLLVLTTLASEAQESLNVELKQRLDSILYKDQTLRELFDNAISEERKLHILNEFGHAKEDFDKGFWSIVDNQDSLNLIEIEGIIEAYGYPGKSLVGEPTNEAAWYIIQHSDKIEKYFPLIRNAGENGELTKRLVAMMEDRMLMDQNKAQIYGTQIAGRKIGESEEWFQFVWPIEKAEKVNELRKELGFNLTVEENAERLGVVYKTYTLKEIDSILNTKKK
jgi:hypothetical protein